jgi:hypothetical protein
LKAYRETYVPQEFREALKSSIVAILSAETGDRESARRRTIEIVERESFCFGDREGLQLGGKPTRMIGDE